MNAYQYLKTIPFLPLSREGGFPNKPSNSEIRRWLKNGSVVINGNKAKPGDEIDFPITELVFFPKGNKVTMWRNKCA